ncbi:hypothetical protein [Niveibacterium sp.]|uniref:hypothetical protein n=1 Tax=Niveibacterium sp. TaxID=2017444 RepID=UPI0035AD943F
MTSSRPYLIAASALLLSACGGGGGGDGSPTPPVSQEITAANMETTAAVVVNTVDAGASLADLSDSFVTGSPALARVRMAERVIGLAPKVAAQVYDASRPCTGGGSVAVSLNDADNNLALTAGDSARLSFTNCTEDGASFNGIYDLSITAASGDFLAGTGAMGMSLGIHNLVGVYGTERVSMNGNATLSLIQSSTTYATATMTMSNMVVATSGGTAGDASVSIPSATIAAVRNGASASLTFSEQLGIQHSAYSGSVSVVSEQAVYYTSRSDLYPSAGRIRTSTGKSTLWLTYLGGDAAQLDLDANGDGGVDTTKQVKLSELDKL